MARNRYRHNFCRHLLGVARYLQNTMMTALHQQYGHEHLRLSFSPYIILLGEGDKRLTDLAEILGISRQACNQAAKQVVAAGYIDRIADPEDGRAKQLTLSSHGIKLRRDGLHIVAELDQQLAKIIDGSRILDASKSLRKISHRHSLDGQKRKLKWVHSLGTCTVVGKFSCGFILLVEPSRAAKG